ncbi:MAG: hypothetical protein CBE14_001820 [Rickettsiales bacterium TMED254]|nr:MAG: hypothetical protein CBE14_001820 [Rickettsiales bacterium TMED254]
MKKFLKLFYNLIKYPASLIFFKTPLKKILISYMKNYRSIKNRGLLFKFISTLFWEEYYNKLDLKEKDRIRDLTLSFGEGKLWASQYYKEKLQTFDDLKKIKIGSMTKFDCNIIYTKIFNYVEDLSKTFDHKNIYLLQIGSSSGRDLNFFRNYFPKINFISTDINDEILNFQKKNYNYPNFKFFKLYAKNIKECIKHFDIYEKKKIIFSIGSAQYFSPVELDIFFNAISKLNDVEFFLDEPISIDFLNQNKHSSHRHNISYNHKYDEYAEKNELIIVKKKITFPFSKKDLNHLDTCNYFLQCRSNNS